MSDSPSDMNGTAAGSALEETLWLMSQQSRVLQDLRKDVGHVWDDEAAREINSRFLNLHEEDDVRMRSEMNEQRQLLERAGRELESAKEFAQQADECAAAVAEKLQFTEQDMDSAYSNFDLYVHYNAEANSKFPVVQELIRRANASCG
jgi:hypothetical protein